MLEQAISYPESTANWAPTSDSPVRIFEAELSCTPTLPLYTIFLLMQLLDSECGLATHFVPSRRLPGLIEKLNGLDNPTFTHVDSLIEDHYSEREPDEPTSSLVGAKRAALDFAFRHDKVESIIEDLKAIAQKHQSEDVKEWAQKTLDALDLRSPTSLRIALTAIRRGEVLTLREALQMELNFATAICVSSSSSYSSNTLAYYVLIEWGNPRFCDWRNSCAR